MLGVGAGGTARVRLLHESVDRLAVEIRLTREAWTKTPSALPKDLRPVLDRLAAVMEQAVAQMQRTNEHLARLARTPLLGALGGGAQQEIDRLVSSSERLVEAVREIRRLFP